MINGARHAPIALSLPLMAVILGMGACTKYTVALSDAGDTGVATDAGGDAPRLPDAGPDASTDLGGDVASDAPGHCSTAAECPPCGTCSAVGQCTPLLNQDDPVAGRCAGTCDATGACKSKKGQTCTTVPAGCASSTVCAPDGYCCDIACTGPCVACDIPGKQGTCTALGVNGASHPGHGACAGAGTVCAGSCDGAGSCGYPTPAPACTTGTTCSNNNIVD